MNKFKLFLENMLVYGIGGIISRLIPLIMLPIVTRLMPGTEAFGVSDMATTVSQFGGALAIMGMYDAMYRMFFDKDDLQYKKRVCSTAVVYTFCTSAIVFIALLLCKKYIAIYILGNIQYTYIVYLAAMATLVGATNGIISAPTRMQNKRKVFLITNTVSPILSYSISIPLILKGHYMIALPLAAMISGFVMELSFFTMNREWFHPKLFDKKLLKQLLFIAIPLLPNFLIYWIFNSSDKIMITNMIGIGAAGIYAIGSKLGNVSQLIYTAFAGGWQFFAFSTMKEKNQVKTNSMIFEYLGVVSFIATTFICAWSYLFYKVLFSQQYLSGYRVAPYLFLAPLLQMLFQIAANQFLVIKKTWPNFLVLSSGAVLNIVLNLVLIPVLGIEGASIATLVGYLVSVVICVIVICKMKLMIVSGKFMISAVLMMVYMIIWRLFFSDNTILGTFFAIIATVIFVLIYKNDLKKFAGMIKNR